MGKISERMNGLEKDVLKTMMDFIPSGAFSTMGTFGAEEDKMMKTVTNIAVSTLAYCEEASEALDKIEELEEKLDSVLENQKHIEKCLTVMMGHSKAEFTELGTRFDGLEEAVRELADKRNNQPRKAEKEKKEE